MFQQKTAGTCPHPTIIVYFKSAHVLQKRFHDLQATFFCANVVSHANLARVSCEAQTSYHTQILHASLARHKHRITRKSRTRLLRGTNVVSHANLARVSCEAQTSYHTQISHASFARHKRRITRKFRAYLIVMHRSHQKNPPLPKSS